MTTVEWIAVGGTVSYCAIWHWLAHCAIDNGKAEKW